MNLYINPEDILRSTVYPLERVRSSILESEIGRTASVLLLEVGGYDIFELESDEAQDRFCANTKRIVDDFVFSSEKLLDSVIDDAQSPTMRLHVDLNDKSLAYRSEHFIDLPDNIEDFDFETYSERVEMLGMGVFQASVVALTANEEGDSFMIDIESIESELMQHERLLGLSDLANSVSRGVFERDVILTGQGMRNRQPILFRAIEQHIDRDGIDLQLLMDLTSEYSWHIGVHIVGRGVVDGGVPVGVKSRLLSSDLLKRTSGVDSGLQSSLSLVRQISDAAADGDLFDPELLDHIDPDVGRTSRPELLGLENNEYSALKQIFALQAKISDHFEIAALAKPSSGEIHMGGREVKEIIASLELIADEIYRDPDLEAEDLARIFEHYFNTSLRKFLQSMLGKNDLLEYEELLDRWGNGEYVEYIDADYEEESSHHRGPNDHMGEGGLIEEYMTSDFIEALRLEFGDDFDDDGGW